jgi:hypothetical protein
MIQRQFNTFRIINGIFFIFIYLSLSPAANFYVSLSGNDSYPGTKSKPFATIIRARDAVRELVVQGLKENITVFIQEGTYRLTEPIIFDIRDSGTKEYRITYTTLLGGKVIISGGKIITGWRLSPDGKWHTTLANDQQVNGNLRELFVNGRRAIRARHPDVGYLRVEKVGEDRMSAFSFNDGDIPEKVRTENTELVFIHDWSISRIPLRDIDYTHHTIYPVSKIGRQHFMMVIDGYEPHPRYFIENDPAICDTPGEWCLKTDGELIYFPGENERIENTRIVVPLAQQLLVVSGKNEDNIPVRNLHFVGLIFEHCAFYPPVNGYAGVQASFHALGDQPGFEKGWRRYVTPAISFEIAEQCSFRDGVIRHLGGAGIIFGSRCQNCVISGSVLTDISGNGIMIGESRDRVVAGLPWWKSLPAEAASMNTVKNCLVEQCGIQYSGAVGIWVGLARKTIIAHNEIRFLPYTGVSVGWMWNPDITPCKENIIENNHIHHVMQVLSDGGGIYTLGYQPGTILRGNLIHDVPLNAGRAESNGMFLDEGTTDIIIENNAFYGIDKSPLRFHKAGVNRVRNNILGMSPENPSIRYNSTEEQDIKQDNNKIILIDTGTKDDFQKAIKTIKERAGIFSRFGYDK